MKIKNIAAICKKNKYAVIYERYGESGGVIQYIGDGAAAYPVTGLPALDKESLLTILQTVESLIRNAAFMAVSLEELQEIINEEGYTVEYQNGANQSGTKQSDAVKTHIAMTKNHAAIIKQLCELVPPEKKKESRLQALRDE